jgi:hypothetical protein
VRVAQRGEVWEWCAWDHGVHGVYWHPYLMISKLQPTIGNADFDDWEVLDLFTGEVEKVTSVPAMGWEKAE